MSDVVQFDTSDTIVGGVNITEAIRIEKKVVFNESYTISGECIASPFIYACYDLTVIGNVEAEKIDVRGNLFVIGNIKAKHVSCLKTIMCSGDIDAETVSASEIIANDITSQELSCAGNVIVRSTIDISESLSVDKSVMTGEGIIGNGSFSAKNAIAAEYFDFNGTVFGKAVELETDEVFGKLNSFSQQEETFLDLSVRLKSKITEELQKAGEVDENELIEYVTQIAEADADRFFDWKKLTEKIVELSYADKVTNFRDYLIIIMATKLLPEEIIGYETIEHVFDKLLVDAEKELSTLLFHAQSIDEFAYAIKIVTLCENEIRLEKDEALDRIFQSVGIKYKTVKAFLG